MYLLDAIRMLQRRAERVVAAERANIDVHGNGIGSVEEGVAEFLPYRRRRHVIVPDLDVASRLSHYFPALRVQVKPH